MAALLKPAMIFAKSAVVGFGVFSGRSRTGGVGEESF
jgi:hypothetical protein